MKDQQLSPHVSLYDLTRTDHEDLQAQNREVSRAELLKLAECANLLETFRIVLGCDLDIHSGRRCKALNDLVGSTDRSQHLKCEAFDFSPAGPDTLESIHAAFDKLIAAAKLGKFKFGQLIEESSESGREGRKFWLHGSLGAPYRDKARCGECLHITVRDGKPLTELIAKISGSV